MCNYVPEANVNAKMRMRHRDNAFNAYAYMHTRNGMCRVNRMGHLYDTP